MSFIYAIVMLLLLSSASPSWADVSVDELVASNYKIEQQLSLIAQQLNQLKDQPEGHQDWKQIKSIWQPEFDIIDSLRIGSNTLRLFKAIPSGKQQRLSLMTAHHNLYIAFQMCEQNLATLRLYRNACLDKTLKQAIQKQYQHAQQGCKQLQQASEQIYVASQKGS